MSGYAHARICAGSVAVEATVTEAKGAAMGENTVHAVCRNALGSSSRRHKARSCALDPCKVRCHQFIILGGAERFFCLSDDGGVFGREAVRRARRSW